MSELERDIYAKKKRQRMLYINMAMMLASGTMLSVVVQYQNETLGHDGKPWRHPYFQSFVACFAHLGGFLAYYIAQKYD